MSGSCKSLLGWLHAGEVQAGNKCGCDLFVVRVFTSYLQATCKARWQPIFTACWAHQASLLAFSGGRSRLYVGWLHGGRACWPAIIVPKGALSACALYLCMSSSPWSPRAPGVKIDQLHLRAAYTIHCAIRTASTVSQYQHSRRTAQQCAALRLSVGCGPAWIVVAATTTLTWFLLTRGRVEQ